MLKIMDAWMEHGSLGCFNVLVLTIPFVHSCILHFCSFVEA